VNVMWTESNPVHSPSLSAKLTFVVPPTDIGFGTAEKVAADTKGTPTTKMAVNAQSATKTERISLPVWDSDVFKT